MKRFSVVLALLISLLFVAQASAAPAKNADAYPGNKTINIVCCYSAGGGVDAVARLVAKYMPEYLGNAIVTNVTGNAGIIGTQQVLDAVPDGYTLVFNDSNTDMLFAQGLTNYGLEAWEGYFIPGLSETAAILVKDWDTIEDCIKWAKANPRKLTVGVMTGGNIELQACAFFTQFGIEGKLIDVGGTAEQIAALAGGHVKMIPVPIGTAKDYLATGEFKAIAMVTPERHPKYPNIPTLIEKGAEDWVYMPRYYYLGFPKGTDKAIVNKFGEAVKKIVADERFVKDMDRLELTPKFYGGADAEKLIADTHRVWLKYAEAVKTFKGKK